MIHRLLQLCAAALVLIASAHGAPAQDVYPSRPLRMLVPYAPGGTTDVLARYFAEQLSRRLGKPVVVENRPGAATNIAGQALVAAEPNGYTLMLGTNQLLINAAFGPVPPFDPVQSLAPVAMVAEIPFTVAVGAGSPIASVADFVAASRKTELAVAHAQFEPQLKLLSAALGVPVLSVPYQGGAAAVTATLGGEVSAMLSAVSAVKAQVKGGRLRMLGVASAKRLPSFPEVPTFAEQGFPRFQTSGWLAVMVPKGTPEPVRRRLAEITAVIVKDPAFVEALRTAGAEPLEAGTRDTVARMKAEQAGWAELAKASHQK